jgi:glycine cleavage system H protein
MNAIPDILSTAVVAIAGIAIRLLLAAAIVAALILVLLPFVAGAEALRRAWLRVAGFEQVAGLTWRSGTYYTPVHTWLRRRARLLRVGFDDIAARVLRQSDAVSLPAEGASVKAGDALLSVTCGGRRFSIPAPIGGVVHRVNRRLSMQPDAVIRDPYRRGWLVELAPADERYTTLPRDLKARGWFAGEAQRLSHALEHATGIVAADGGDLVIPPHLVMSDAQLDALVQDFLAARPAPVPGRA